MSFLTGGGKAVFERLLDTATSQMLLEPSWVTNLEICDCIRQQDVSSKFAVAAIQKRMRDPNPHVSKFALIVLEACVKNCGQPFHEEISNNDFLDDMRTLAQTGSAPVKEQVLTMLQAWNHAFRNKTQFQPILATYNLMRMEGYKFPPLNESDAMFSADAAPAWKDGDVCHLCRVKFGTFTRQHHCRACGECFCSKCSSKQSIIPKMGIEREVRVCDTCHDELNPNAGKTEQPKSKPETESDLPEEYLKSDLAKEVQTKPALSEDEVKAQEEEELQLAMAISLSEEEVKAAPQKNWSLPSTNEVAKPPEMKPPEPPKSTLFSGVAASLQAVAEDNNAELKKYFDRSYWEKKNAEMKSREPSAPAAVPVAVPVPVPVTVQEEYCPPAIDENDSDNGGSEVFVNTMLKSIEMFTDRMNNVRSKGKHIAMDSTVQSLFQSLSAMHPQLMKLIEDEEESKAKYDAMLQKLAVIREARESLNDMRAQYQEKVQQQELEQEMLRRMQMEQKLELMRQQKQEYLEYQRQLQIQRQQDLDHYQLEKLRQKQTFGMNPAFPEYPEVPSHAPGSIPLPAYRAIPAGVQYGGEISLQNAQVPYKERIAIQQPHAESLPENYHDMERPPQYPGSPRQFAPTDNHEHDMPPSYASSVAAEGILPSNPEFYNGDHVQASQWQQPTSFANANELAQNVRQQPPFQPPVNSIAQLPHHSSQLKQHQNPELQIQQQQQPQYNPHMQQPGQLSQQAVQQHPVSHPSQQQLGHQQQIPQVQQQQVTSPPSSIQQQLPPASVHHQQQIPSSTAHQQLPPQGHQIQMQNQPITVQGNQQHTHPTQSHQAPQMQQLPPQNQQQLHPHHPQQQQLSQPHPPHGQQQLLPQAQQQSLPQGQPQLPPQSQQQQLPPQGQQQLPPQGQQQLPPQGQQQLPPQGQQQLPPQGQQQLPPQGQQQLPPQGQQQLPPQGQQQLPPQGQQQLPQQGQHQLPPQVQQQLPPHNQQHQVLQQPIQLQVLQQPQQQQPPAQYQQNSGQMQYFPHDQPIQQNMNDAQFAMNQQQQPQQQQPQQQQQQLQPQQPIYQQQFVPNQTQPPVEAISQSIKDLQLISFD